ncbi:MAG: iron-sulfur cluster co-chaperone HscB C-terminal domain-containing protein [Chitinophagales bacterium]
MTTSNYFEFYGLPISFDIDKKKLKSLFYQKSRAFHPDFFVQATAAAQQEALLSATINNQAYKTLSKLETRIKYVLELKGVISEGERYQLPPMFLMQMMDINESLMELEFEANTQKLQTIQTEVNNIVQNLQNDIQPTLDNYEDKAEQKESLKKIKEFYYKKRYLLRIQNNLRKFASLH